jgi:hypothetical protein
VKHTPEDYHIEANVAARLRTEVALSSIRAVAKRYKVSATYVQAVCAGRMRPGAKILKALGFKRVVLYVRRDAK